ncbi:MULTISPECIES: sensor domain-containing diguanylate cyclase [unclassified Paenibacillus]|uniref:sensor domain-containing diguanylate cyclase n=1 Tax=unclassified Paenibacillus TaxID=185978 RepID=UPI0024076E64|nr:MULTISPECIES: sensor domain-containing diguanylate cyclase [unclassified Paenibacillus]
MINNTLELNYSTAQQMSQTMDTLFESMSASLGNVSLLLVGNDGLLSNADLAFNLDLARSSSSSFNSLMAVDEKGQILAVSPASVGGVGAYISSEQALHALDSRKPFISEVYTTPRTKRRIILVTEPVFDKQGNYRGMIGGTIYLENKNILNEIFGSQIKKDRSSYFYIVDSKGVVVYHPDKARIGKDLSSLSVIQQLNNDREGKGQYINLSGVDLLAGYTKVPSTDWGLVVVSPAQTIYNQLYQHVKIMLLYMAVPLLLLLLVVIWSAYKIVNPFILLANLVQRFDQGNTEIPELRAHWNREADLLTRTVMGALRNVQRQNERLSQEAKTDTLTGLANRRMFEGTLNHWTEQDIPFAILVLDIDRFKTINDTYGHQAGDSVLKHVADIIQENIASPDLSVRYGGEEFVVLLKNKDSTLAFRAAEQVRSAVEKSAVPGQIPVTVSIGIALYPQHATDSSELFHLADNAMYQAKTEGRNRTVIIQNP